MKIKNNVAKLCLKQGASIKEAMRVITQGEERTCFLVDAHNKLLRVISDGDIRRALLKGHSLDSSAENIHNAKPFVVTEGQNMEEARYYLSKRIAVVPIVNHIGKIKGILRFCDLDNLINIRSRKILVIGMGYIGLTLALVLADLGFTVYAFDYNRDIINKLKNKKAPFYENGLEDYLGKHAGNNLRFINSLKGFFADIYIICVGTPISKATLRPKIIYIENAAREVAMMLKKNDLVILRSTVPVGLTRKTVIPLLERKSKLIAGNDFFLAYCPERTVEGRALEELRKNPQIIGGYDQRSTELASRLFNENTHTVIDVGSLEAAEMCKLLDNTYRDTMFAYSNQIAMFCEKAGLNMHELIEKVNLLYHRNFIPKPSPGVGGTCLSKDPYILIQNFREYGLEPPLLIFARQINEMAQRLMYKRSNNILSKAGKSLGRGKIFIIGFAFKGEPETSDLRESTTVWFLRELQKNKVGNIWGYDPVISPSELKKLGVRPCSIEAGFRNADSVFIMNNHHSYKGLRIFRLIETMNLPALFFDCWRIFVPADMRNIPGVLYAGIGIG